MDTGGGGGGGGGGEDTVIVRTLLQGQPEIQIHILRKELTNEA